MNDTPQQTRPMGMTGLGTPGIDLPDRLMRPMPDKGSRLGALLAWCVIVLVAGYVTIQHNLPASVPVAGSPAAEQIAPPALTGAIAQCIVGYDASPAERAEALGGVSIFVKTPLDRARMAVVAAEVIGRDAGAKAVEAARAEAPPSSAVLGEILLLQRLIDGQRPASLDDPAMLKQFHEHHGFFAEVALNLYKPDTDPARAAMLTKARGAASRMVVGGLAAVAVVTLVLGMFITALTLLLMGKIKAAMPRATPGGSVYVEAFAIFLVAFLGLTFLVSSVDLPTWAVAALRWLLLLAALWPMLRGQSWTHTRAGLGWHAGRGVINEMLAGMAGYLAFVPLIAVVAALTFYFAGDAVKLHPLGDQVVRATPLELVLLIQLATLWAPLVEESMFRGALYRHVRGWVGALASALLVALIFAAIHPQGLAGIPVLMTIAFAFSMLREWRGSLIAPVTAHAMNNALVVLVPIMLRG